MICSNNEPWIFGAENVFARLGFSLCAVSWIEFLMVACTAGVFLLLAGSIAYTIARRLEWFYLKLRTRSTNVTVAADAPQ